MARYFCGDGSILLLDCNDLSAASRRLPIRSMGLAYDLQFQLWTLLERFLSEQSHQSNSDVFRVDCARISRQNILENLIK